MLGVCNGFQILTEAGLLPGALTRNAHQRFECGDWFVKVTSEGPVHARASATSGSCRSPTARAATRPTPRRSAGSRTRGASAFATATPAGALDERANPNGSLDAIAGIYGGPRKNVFGLMPHPERMSEALIGGADGRKLFDRVLSLSTL